MFFICNVELGLDSVKERRNVGEYVGSKNYVSDIAVVDRVKYTRSFPRPKQRKDS